VSTRNLLLGIATHAANGDAARMGQRAIKIKGAEFARLRNREAMTQMEFAAELGLSPGRVHQIENSEVASIFRGAFRRLAKLIKVEIPELEQRIGYSEPANGHPVTVKNPDGDWDQNVEPFSETPVPDIPLFELPLAAGDWMEVTELCEVKETQFTHGLFRVRLRGESMKPTYPDGTIVEFRCLRADHEGPQVGKDYYVQRSDGYATFKRVAKIEEDSMTLEALNKKQKPRYLVVPRQEVSRMAIAMAKVQLV
jgi:transcriptional regulator with XRE-family HTH domain